MFFYYYMWDYLGTIFFTSEENEKILKNRKGELNQKINSPEVNDN